jgi:ubiquinone/menaquinone biosynthesis C-methylase UbiE
MNKFAEKKNHSFWNNYAKKLKDNPVGAHSDKHIVDLENEFIESILKKIKPKSLLDIGCGNGSRTIRFSKFIKGQTLGIDYSEEMISNAKSLLSKQKKIINKKVAFEILNAKKLEELDTFDIVVSCRCFVNQTSSKNQIKLFNQIHKKLKKNGSLIIAEQSKEGVDNLNLIRKKFGLKNIQIPWHNLPIKEKIVFPKIKKLFKIKKMKRLGSFYFITRVIHPVLVLPHDPNPNALINDLGEKAEILFQNNILDMENALERVGSHLLVHFIKK